ncbi:MAG: ATP-binding protein, partial [Burkholderiales bacterium]
EDRARGRPQELLAAAAREGHIEMTGVRQRKDGSRFWAHARLTALRHPDGKLRGYAKLTRDLTERIQADEHLFAERAQRQAAEAAEQRIRASEEQLARVQRMTAAVSRAATPDQVAEVVLDEGLKAVGAEGGAVYGAAEGGSTLTLLRQHGHPRESEANFRTLDLSSKGPLTDAARKQLPLFLDSYATCAELYPHLREAMSRGGFEASAALPLIAHGQLMGVLGVRYSEPRAISDARRTMLMTISDICAQALERARLFAAEQRARLEAEAANRAKDEFLAMLGHELRNPLAPIVTAVQLMRLRGDGALEKERGVIERQVTHLTRLVDDLLDVSRITQGKVELHLQRVEVAEVVARALEMASPLLEQRHQHVAASVPQRGLAVDADPMRLSQVISNLLTNAARYTNPGGHIAITAERSQGHVAVRVKDDGIGIAPEMLPRIFDLFVQGHRKLDRSEGGLGLGLSIVHTLMSLHGGKVHAFSDGPDKGSEFVVELPAATVQDSQVPASPLQVAPSSSSGRRILVVDDNEDAAELLADFLRSSGHVARVAHDGPGALRIVTEFKPQAALLDIGLPVMDGYELARRLREQIANLQLVAISGYGQESDRKRALEAGFQGHLVKPVELEVLRRVLDAVNVGTEAADSRQARNSRI